MLEDIKITVDEFGGLYYRGLDDSIPPDHMRQCTNAIFNARQVQTRPGTLLTYAFSFQPRKAFLGVIGTTRFFLILDNFGGIHRDTSAPIMLIGTAFDFAALNLYNRIYISPNSAGTTTNPDYLWVYTGTGSARLAGGTKPGSSLTAVNNAAAGVVSKGVHQFAVSFVTDTGFITPPSALTSYTAPGATQVNISTIPTGAAGTGTVGRRILCTKAGETELFFVPDNGIINDNSTVAVTLNFADTDLVASADYLNDIYERIPAGTQLVFYKGRLVVICGNWLALVSNVQDPETFSTVNGFLAVPSEDYLANPVISGWVLRDTLYISKFPGVYAVQDTGDPSPNNWPVTVVDESIGCYPNGIASYTGQASGRSTSDYDILLTQQGIVLFDGVFRRPPMSWKIEGLWNKVVQDQLVNPLGVNYLFWSFTISHDVVLKRIYVNCSTITPDTVSGIQYFLLFADYSEGLDAQHVKWSPWTFLYRPSVAVMALHPVDNKYALRIMSFTDTKMWTLDPSVDTDALTGGGTGTILCVLETGLLDRVSGMLHFFLGVRLRVKGLATVITFILNDGVHTATTTVMLMDNVATKDYQKLMNFTSEKARLLMHGGGPFAISRVDIHCKPMFLQRPQV